MIIHRKQNFPKPFLTLTELKSHTVRGFYEVKEMKKCFECKVDQPLTEFYKHSGMVGGRVGRCKTCTKAGVSANYRKNIEHYKEYERGRAMLPHRVKRRKEYEATPAGIASLRAAKAKHANAYPKQKYATGKISFAIKKGLVIRPDSCSSCSKPCIPQAHHCDYNKPLDVIFLCTTCHAKWHKNNTPLNKG